MAIDLCTVKKADKPYRIESVQIEVWTIEELCFFLRHNLFLIDSSILCEQLADWISDQLDLRALGSRLKAALQRPDRDASYFIMPIFAQIGYLSPGDQREVRRLLTQAQVQPEEEGAKRKADYLLAGGMTQEAQTRYRRILREAASGKLKTSFLEAVWNNLGCAYAREYRYPEAADSFRKGYELGHSRELLRKYLCVLPLYLDRDAYLDRLKEIDADPLWVSQLQKQTAGLAEDLAEGIAAQMSPDEDLQEAADRMMAEYRRCVS